MSLLPRGRGRRDLLVAMHPRRRDLLVSISPSITEFPDFCKPNSRSLGTARGTLSHARVACEGPSPTVRRGTPLCRARAPALDPFGSRRSRTTVFYRIRARRGPVPRPTERGSFFHRSEGQGTNCIETRRSLLHGFDFQFYLASFYWTCYHFEIL